MRKRLWIWTAISAEARRLAGMVTSLVGLGRIQGAAEGRGVLALDSLVLETVRIYQSMFKQKENILTAEVDPDLPSVEGDAGQLVQVLINLLSNATNIRERAGFPSGWKIWGSSSG